MQDVELYQLLTQFGVDEKTAQQIQHNINGSDIINLVNSLKSNNRQDAVQQSNKILSRYGISIKEGNMKSDISNLHALYTRGDKKIVPENIKLSVIENLIPIEESSKSSDHLLALEGFNYFTQLDKNLGEELIDWLDENEVEFLTNGDGHFHIKCEDRDHAYKVGRTISGIVRKQRLVRDSKLTGDQNMNEKSFKSQINKTKQQIADLRPRDPNAVSLVKMQAKNGGPIDPTKKVDQKDKFGRNAKHKGNRWDEHAEYKIGESVIVNDQNATIKIPYGPDGTVGIIMDGRLSMVKYDDISRLDEGVIGSLKSISPLFRLRELAGLPPAPASELSLPSQKNDTIDTMNDMPMPSDDLSGSEIIPHDSELDNMGGIDDIDSMSSVSSNPVDDLISDFAGDDDMPDMNIDHDDIGGMPGDLPSENPEFAGKMGPTSSPAMNAIEDHLNNIQSQLASITLGEYKSLVNKIQELTNQIQIMGRSYLGERRKK